MAHRFTAPALQRAQRLLQQWVRPQVTSQVLSFDVEATAELFESVSFEEAVALPRTPFPIGGAWGKPWHTVWFELSAVAPDTVDGRPLVASVDLGFSGRGDGFQVEAMAWVDGRRLQAIQPDRRLVPLGVRTPGERIEVWVEAAATPIIAGHAFGYGPTPLGDPLTSGEGALYALRKADLAVHCREVEELAGLLHSMIDLIVDSDANSPQRARLFDLVDKVAEVVDVRSISETAPAAIDLIRSEARRWSRSTSHVITAVGHAHLDTAWLWPIRETRRKAVRTFANAVRLLEENPDAVFCHSQAQHYEWVSEDAPEIFEKVKHLVEEGRWEPVGGMWVETDLNLPSGESLIRQFLHGHRAFDEMFPQRETTGPAGAFLPDDFGYPGTLPQIIRHCGGEWFFSQKLSWNETNRFPHHTFWWEGIDGSRVFAHFSPVETYNALMTPSQTRFAERNFSDHAGSSKSLALYGHGDGGGGPTQQMVDRVRESSLWTDVPEVRFGTVAGFFTEAAAEYSDRAPVWVGEMYLEKHRGTYSSQLATKNGNRRCERLLHEWELWSACSEGESPESRRARLTSWRKVLTQQFHDIIPGSSIAWVHRDAEDEHRDVAATANEHIDRLFGTTTAEWANTSDPAGVDALDAMPVSIANPSPVPRCGVERVAGEFHWVDVPAMACRPFESSAEPPAHVDPVVVDAQASGAVTVSNGLVAFAVDEHGSISDVVDVRQSRSILRPEGFIGLCLRRDTPAEYDAWDIDLADADSPAVELRAAGAAAIVEAGDLAATVSCRYVFGRSQFELSLTLRAGESTIDLRLEGDWHERETRMQFCVPTDVLSREAICGTQFGHVRRPRHANTSWDAAKFEVCAHRYAYVNEPGLGIALVADGPRGYDLRGDAIRLTLLRSPSFPDPRCDEGRRIVEWGLRLDDGPGDVGELERAATRQAHPIRLVRGEARALAAPVSIEVPGALISAIKPAEDADGDVVVRVWETRGARAQGVLRLGAFAWATRANGLEEPSEEFDIRRDEHGDAFVDVELRPFEIATLRLGRTR